MRHSIFALGMMLAAPGVLPQEVPEVPRCSLTGDVINSATGASVRYARLSVSGPQPGNLVSDQNGGFALHSLLPGTYTLSAQQENFPSPLDLPALTVSVTAKPGEDLAGIRVPLTPAGVISGKVVNDDGEPVPNCNVAAYSPMFLTGPLILSQRNPNTTNDLGEFRLHGLAAGRYYIYARCDENLAETQPLGPVDRRQRRPTESWLPVFYPNAISPAAAQSIVVVPGSEVGNVDFYLSPTPVAVLAGTVQNPCGPADGGNISIGLQPAGSEDIRGIGNQVGVDPRTGRFQFFFVPPGHYTLHAVAWAQDPAPICSAALPVFLGAAGLENLRVPLQPGVTIAGKLEEPPQSDPSPAPAGGTIGSAVVEPPKARILAEMAFDSGSIAQRNAEVARDGTFELKGIAPGRWRLAVTPSDRRNMVESITWNGRELEGHELEILSGFAGGLSIRVGGSAVVQGMVSGMESQAVHPVSVWVVPARFSDIDSTTARQFISDDTGRFRLEGLPAGEFRLFALDGVSPGDLRRFAEVMASQVGTVSIPADAQKLVTAPLIDGAVILRAALAYLQGVR